jgi:hypothetical protein
MCTNERMLCKRGIFSNVSGCCTVQISVVLSDTHLIFPLFFLSMAKRISVRTTQMITLELLRHVFRLTELCT